MALTMEFVGEILLSFVFFAAFTSASLKVCFSCFEIGVETLLGSKYFKFSVSFGGLFMQIASGTLFVVCGPIGGLFCSICTCTFGSGFWGIPASFWEISAFFWGSIGGLFCSMYMCALGSGFWGIPASFWGISAFFWAISGDGGFWGSIGGVFCSGGGRGFGRSGGWGAKVRGGGFGGTSSISDVFVFVIVAGVGFGCSGMSGSYLIVL